MLKSALLAGVAVVALSASAHAALITSTALFSPTPIVGTTTVIGVQTATPLPSATQITGTGYNVMFAGGATLVQGAATINAIPVSGSIPPNTVGGQPTFLVGDFGSASTTSTAASGRYLSTGLGTITINFTTAAQRSFSLLWGSVDVGNSLQFFNGAMNVGTVTGTDVQAAPGFAGNGNQGAGGSSFVTINSTLDFNRVVATSNVVSFEFAGAVGATQPITVPEPISLALLGSGLLGMGLVSRRRKV